MAKKIGPFGDERDNLADETLEEQVWDLIDEAHDLPHGPTQVALGEEAVRVADSSGDLQLGFAARDELINFAQFSGQPQSSLVAFTWCLSMCDKYPDQFPESELFWKYKWIIAGLPAFPSVSRQQIEESLVDMTRRLERNGHGLKSIYKLRFRNSLNLGDFDDATAYFRKWQDAPPDDNQDCAACNLDDVVDWDIENDRDEEALKKALPLTSGRLSCAEVPHTTYASLLRCTLRLGRHADGKRFHEEGVRLIGANGGEFLREIGLHLEWLAYTTQFARGLRLLEKHLRWAFVSGDPDDRFAFFLGAHTLLDRMLTTGAEIPLHVRLPREFPVAKPDGTWEPLVARDWFGAQVAEAAKKFDARNGNDWCSGHVARHRALVEFAVELE